MSIELSEIIRKFEEHIPLSYQESYDRSGLQVGSRKQKVKKVLFALDVCREVLEAAIKSKADLIVSHHPLQMRDWKNIDLDSYEGGLVNLALQNNIAIYTAHTNHDASRYSLNRHYATKLGVTHPEVIQPLSQTPYLKLVVFVPHTHTAKVLNALFEAGAGHIGAYSHCSFRAPGIGTFKGDASSHPFLGQKGNLTEAQEDKTEVVLETRNLTRVLEALHTAHPYEEIAYDIIPLGNQSLGIGHGIWGHLAKPIPAKEAVAQIKKIFGVKSCVFVGNSKKTIQTLGLCTGSGTSLLPRVFQLKLDFFITGDVKYHYAIDALRHDTCLVDVGHFQSEIRSVTLLRGLFKEWFDGKLELDEYTKLKSPLQMV